jgi:hypothetical protein
MRIRRHPATLTLYSALLAAAACIPGHGAPRPAPSGPRAGATSRAASPLVGVWELVSVTTRWPDGRVTEPWGAHPIGRLTYGPDGRMAALLMDGRRNQADGRAVPPELSTSAASYYGTFVVDTARRVVTHHVAASLRAAESGAIERRYELRDGTLILVAAAMYEGSPVTHTLVWRRAPASAP